MLPTQFIEGAAVGVCCQSLPIFLYCHGTWTTLQILAHHHHLVLQFHSMCIGCKAWKASDWRPCSFCRQNLCINIHKIMDQLTAQLCCLHSHEMFKAWTSCLCKVKQGFLCPPGSETLPSEFKVTPGTSELAAREELRVVVEFTAREKKQMAEKVVVQVQMLMCSHCSDAAGRGSLWDAHSIKGLPGTIDIRGCPDTSAAQEVHIAIEGGPHLVALRNNLLLWLVGHRCAGRTTYSSGGADCPQGRGIHDRDPAAPA